MCRWTFCQLCPKFGRGLTVPQVKRQPNSQLNRSTTCREAVCPIQYLFTKYGNLYSRTISVDAPCALSLSTAFESKQTLEFTWSFNVGYEDFKIWQTYIISLLHHSVRISCKPGLQAYFWNVQASCISDTLQSCQFLTQTLVSASKIVSQRCPNFPPPFHCESGFPILIEWVSDHPTDQPLQRQRRFSAPTP